MAFTLRGSASQVETTPTQVLTDRTTLAMDAGLELGRAGAAQDSWNSEGRGTAHAEHLPTHICTALGI